MEVQDCEVKKNASYVRSVVVLKDYGLPQIRKEALGQKPGSFEIHGIASLCLIFGMKDKAASTHQHLLPARHCVLACLKNGLLPTPHTICAAKAQVS